MAANDDDRVVASVRASLLEDRKYDYAGNITVDVAYYEPMEPGAARISSAPSRSPSSCRSRTCG